MADRVVGEAKHSNAPQGVACFYLNYDDMAAHQRTLTFFLENNLIRTTKAGRLYNLLFKLDSQTQSGEYGSDYRPSLRLSTFLDLDTGLWISSIPE